MKNDLRKSTRNYIFLMALIIPFGTKGQSPLMISGNGQLRMLPTADNIAGITYYNFLPQYKPRTKSVAITRFNLYYSDNEGDFVRHNDGDCCRTTNILYDEHGRIVKLQYNNGSDSFLYEDDKIIEFQSKIDNEFAKVERTRFKYDLGGHLESATHKEWTYRYNLDKNGNFTSVISYYNAKERSSMNGFQYDGNHRMIAYHDDISDYLWNYDKEGSLVSYREIGYSLSKGRKGGKDSDYEYQFEYNEDGNPMRCVKYKHGDITVIDVVYEYEYTYTFYPTP